MKPDAAHPARREPAPLVAEIRRLQDERFHSLNHLAGGVAHEFNNLIAGILGSAELLAMDLPEGHPGQETLKQIFEATNHARDFVHKLRAFGLRPPPEFKPIRLQPVIEECLQILRTLVPANVGLHVQISPDCPQVNADSAQIHQAILDLCLYASQGLAGHSDRIKISLKNCPNVHPPADAPGLLQPGPHASLTVQDNGPGLDKTTREHIFHPFRTRRTSGTKVGLELFQVRETILAHQGEIFVESQPGHGLTFRIYLPLAEEGK